MNIELTLSLVSFALISLLAPGPNNLMLMASGAAYGWSKTLPHIIGAITGFTLLMAASIIGLTALLASAPGFALLMKSAGALWLCWFALRFFHPAEEPTDHPSQTARPMRFPEAAVFQWINPSAWAMSIATCAAFEAVAPNLVSRTVIICGVFALAGLIGTLSWTTAGHHLAALFASPRSGPYARKAMGMLVLFAAYLIFKS